MATRASAQEWFFYTRKPDTGKGVWDVRMGAMREAVLEQNDFMFMTVLEVDRMIGDNFTRADLATTNYRGPFYLDWDGADVMDAIAGAKRFINTLETSYGVNPDALYIYLSGSKGVHVEVPAKMFWSNKTPPERGLPYLYAIYGDMARRLSTPCMDLRIYTGRKGRMWRRPNLRRENGLMKVPVTFAELCAIESEGQYKELCSEVRYVKVDESLQVLSETLALLFIEERNSVQARMSSKSSVTKVDLELFDKFRGTLPPTLQNLANGRGVDHSKGLNAISLQLSIVLHRFGITDRTLAQMQVEPLIRSHTQQPGVSHTNFDVAMEHFLQIFDYVGSTQTYEYSKNGLLSILTDSARASAIDLEGRAAVINEAGDVELDFNQAGADLSGMTSHTLDPNRGFVTKDKDGNSKVVLDLKIDLDKVREINDPMNGGTLYQVPGTNVLGVTTVADIPLSAFVSGEHFKSEIGLTYGTVTGDVTGKTASDVGLMIRKACLDNAQRGVNKITSVSHEGLNVTRKSDGSWAVFWADATGCTGNVQEGEYRLSTLGGGRKGCFGSRLIDVKPLRDTEENRELLDTLLNLNGNPFTMGAVLGWFVGTFVRPFVTHSSKKWPLLSVIGQKGTGKTTTVEIMAAMFYAPDQTPIILSASVGTEYGYQTKAGGSNSIPMIIDEVKRSSLTEARWALIESILHNQYSVGQVITRGGGGIPGKKPTDTVNIELRAPVAFIGEFHDAKAAVQERCVIANFENKSKYGRETSVHKLRSNPRFMAGLGRLCLDNALQLDPDTLPNLAQEYEDKLRQKLGNVGSDRLKFNQGVMMLSLDFFKATLRSVFGTTYDDKIDTFIAAMMEPASMENINVKPEISQVLEDIAHLSHSKADMSTHVKSGAHYSLGADYIDINVRDCFDSYSLYSAHLRTKRAFESVQAFTKALKHSDYFRSLNPIDSELGADGVTIIRIDREAFEEFTDCRFKE